MLGREQTSYYLLGLTGWGVCWQVIRLPAVGIFLSIWITGLLWWGIIYFCALPPPPQHFYTFIQKGTCLLTCIYVCVNTHTQSRSCFCGTKAKRFCYISENKTQQAVLCLKLNEWLAILVCKYEVLMDTTAKVYMAEELQKQKCWLTGYYFLVTTPAKGQT